MELFIDILRAVAYGLLISLVVYVWLGSLPKSTESVRGNIRYTYDKKAHMGYIYLNDRDGQNTQGIRTEEIAPGVFGDFEISTGALLGLEIFDTRSKP